MKLGIIGNGFVGKATQLLHNSHTELFIYDIIPEKCEPKGLTLNDLKNCSLIFIALPTPMTGTGECYTNFIESIVLELKEIINPKETFLIVRSTVPPGTCRNLDVYFMPEFLTEKNWKNDFITCKHWIFGTKEIDEDANFKMKIIELFFWAQYEGKISYNTIHFVSLEEAEMCKYVRNCFLAMKVSFFNEMEEFARKKGISYENVRKIVTLDNRIGETHTKVPGIDNKRGFGSTCLPKDTNAFLQEMNKIGMNSLILKSVIERNETVDRPEKDWIQNFGRSVIFK